MGHGVLVEREGRNDGKASVLSRRPDLHITASQVFIQSITNKWISGRVRMWARPCELRVFAEGTG